MYLQLKFHLPVGQTVLELVLARQKIKSSRASDNQFFVKTGTLYRSTAPDRQFYVLVKQQKATNQLFAKTLTRYLTCTTHLSLYTIIQNFIWIQATITKIQLRPDKFYKLKEQQRAKIQIFLKILTRHLAYIIHLSLKTII